jgi:hypothetical protein
MKVKELIEELKKYDGEMKVFMIDQYGIDFIPVEIVEGKIIYDSVSETNFPTTEKNYLFFYKDNEDISEIEKVLLMYRE